MNTRDDFDEDFDDQDFDDEGFDDEGFDDEGFEDGDFEDADDSLAEDLTPCPFCGVEIFDDSQQCPACGMYITHSTSPWAGRPAWWIVLGAIGLIATVLALALT